MNHDERVLMVFAEDGNGNTHLFASDDRERSEAALQTMQERFGNARANWLEGAPEPLGRGC